MNDCDSEKRSAANVSGVSRELIPKLGLPEAAVLGVLPVLMWSILPIQLFPPPGWVDPMLYLGYFLNLADSLQRFGPEYYGMRLPWVVVGFAAHHLFSPTVAHLALVFAFNLLAISSLYLIVTPRAGRFTGLAASLFLTLNPLWIAAVARGYVDGPAIAFELACLAAAAGAPRLWNTACGGLLAGAMGSMAIYTNPIAGVQTAITVLAWLLSDRMPWRDIARLTAYALVSFTAVTIGLGLVSTHFGGPFLFFMANLRQTTAAIQGHGHLYARPLASWLPSAYGLFPFIGLLLLGGVTPILAGGVTGRVRLLFSGWSVLATTAMAFAIYDYALRSVLLQTPFYLSYLIPGEALVFAGLFHLATSDRQPRYQVVSFGWALAAGCIPFALVSPLWSVENALRPWIGMWILLAALIIFAGVILSRGFRQFAPAAILLAICLAGAINGDTKRIFRVEDNVEYRPLYLAAVRLNALVQSHISSGQKLLIWYQRAESTTGDSKVDRWMIYRLVYQEKAIDLTPYDSLASLWLWDRSILGVSMPILAAPEIAMINRSSEAVVVLLCTKTALCYEGFEVLKGTGRSIVVKEFARIQESAYVDLKVMVLDVK